MRNTVMSKWRETFFTCPQPQENAPLILELAGITHPDPAYRISRPASNGIFVLEYVIRGRGEIYYDDQHYSPEAGDAYFLQPHASHYYYSDPEDPWEKVWFNLRGPLMDKLCEAYNLQGMIYYRNCPLQEDFFKGLKIVRNWQADSAERFALQIHRIISCLYSWRNRNPEWNKSADGLKLKEYLDLNWQKPVTIGKLAKLIRKSPAQMMRIFRHDWNDTPNHYLQELRSSYSCRYLENTDCPVKELARLMGFKDEFYFSNWFKQRTGVSPSQYRNRFR